MDARVDKEFQPRRANIKRPWQEESTLHEQNVATFEKLRNGGFGRAGAYLRNASPPVDAVPSPRPSIPREQEFAKSHYGPDLRRSTAKRAKVEEHDYNSHNRQILDPGIRSRPARRTNTGYAQNRRSSSPSIIIIPPKPPTPPNGPAESQNNSNVCTRCRRLATQDRELELFGAPASCGVCSRNPELAWVTQAAAAGLTQLVHTLSSGITSEQRGIIRGPEQHHFSAIDCPPVAQFGLKPTLNWILGKINELNYIADELVNQVPTGILKDYRKGGPNGTPQDGSSIMKRRIDVDSEDASRTTNERIEFTSDAKPYTRRRAEELPPLTSHPDYHYALQPLDSQGMRGARDPMALANQPPMRSPMDPPPARTRQLPSPPGRSLPSPSASSYGSISQSLNHLPPPAIHQSTIKNYLPPISTTHSPDSALVDHSRTLQHDVSVQKLALSSLQGEHDKLLSAFSRSQTRASALEKKHAVSDSEIISLTEEKLRLQQQVIELERDVAELSQSRGEYRQAAVQEGSQYVKIVERATRLEEMAGEERRSWHKLKMDMEKKIETLSENKGRRDDMTGPSSGDVYSALRIAEDMDTETRSSSFDLSVEVKMVPTMMQQHTTQPPTPGPVFMAQESAEYLKEEIRRLRGRCSEVEGALKAIQSMGRALVEQADAALSD